MYGDVIGIKDGITFQGTSVSELEKAFKDSVDDYISWCKERGEQPQKAFSGNLRLRIPAELHAHLSVEAARKGISLNQLIAGKLQN